MTLAGKNKAGVARVLTRGVLGVALDTVEGWQTEKSDGLKQEDLNNRGYTANESLNWRLFFGRRVDESHVYMTIEVNTGSFKYEQVYWNDGLGV